MTKQALHLFTLLLLAGPSASAADSSEWYPFNPTNKLSQPSLIGLQDWVDGPAGSKGRIMLDGDRFVLDGEPVKIWGTNIGFANSAPSKEDAEKITAWYVKMGLNALRHHKHLDGPGWAGIQSEESAVAFDPEKLDRFDYFNSLLKKAGITIKHSPTFGTRFGPDDAENVPYWRELGNFESRLKRIEFSPNATALSREISDIQIEQTVNFLNHTNPYTGLRYADEPQLVVVELLNEGTPLFGVNSVLHQSPTLRGRMASQFSAFLLKKYGDDASWRKAWGEQAIVSHPDEIEFNHLKNLIAPQRITGDFTAESIEASTVIPWANPWFNDNALNDGPIAPLRQRLLDTVVFFYELQNEYYERFEAAVRETGYDGPIVRSNWQAGSLVGHLLNLYSDARSGVIDRHNYYKGGGFAGLREGNEFNNHSMLIQSGGGNYTAGFQQVEGAAFMLSEWTHEQPNEYYAEGLISMGAYGFGLQGWDASYHFLFGPRAGFSERIGLNTWDASNPGIAITFPAVSRMVRRMDVSESPQTFYLNAHVPSLKEGKMSFMGITEQNRDQKTFSADKAPVEALAAERIAVRFTDEYTDTPEFDLQPYLDGDTVVSSTGELRWTPSPHPPENGGHITIATKGTKAFVGFAPGGETFDLGDGFRITPDRGYAVIILTAHSPGKDLLSDESILVTAVARVRNTGMELDETESKVLKVGSAPILLEPVKALIETPFSGTIDVLDHDGAATTRSVNYGGRFTLDNAQTPTPFFLIRK